MLSHIGDKRLKADLCTSYDCVSLEYVARRRAPLLFCVSRELPRDPEGGDSEVLDSTLKHLVFGLSKLRWSCQSY